MRAWQMLSLRVRSLLRPGRVEEDLTRELQFHLDRQVAENLAAGMAPDAARLAARRALGGCDLAAEQCRDVRGVRPLQDLGRDLRYALRGLRRTPAFSLVAVLTLALGIGATTAIFSVVDGVILRPLPFPEPGRIVSLGTRFIKEGRETARLTGGDLGDLRGRRAFEALSAYWGGEIGVQVNGGGQFAGIYFVEPAFFRIFGVSPATGRLFQSRDGERAAVVGEGFAERAFGDPRRALGKTISVERQPYEIVGVLPRGFDSPRQTDVWVPMPRVPAIALNRTAYNFLAVARLAPGVSVQQARAEVEALGARLAAAYPDSNAERTFAVTPLHDRLVAPVRSTIYVLLAAVLVVLAIACANVANLLLARATTRSHEIAMRAALGASRGRLIRQLVAESLLLAAIGGALGVVLAYAGTATLVHAAPANLPRLAEVQVDWRVLGFAVACSLLASLVFGLAPAWQTSRLDAAAGLKQGSSRGVVGGHGTRLRNLFVVGEIAVSFALAIGAGLLLRSFASLTTVDLGYRPESVVVMQAHRPAAARDEYVRVAAFFNGIGSELGTIPGVTTVAAAMGLPAGQYGSNGAYFVEGRPEPALQRAPNAGFRLASPGYFAALGVPLIAGRDFALRDAYDAPFVAIVSRALARSTFAGEDPIGRRIRCGLDAPDTWMTIVGVVGDVRQDSPAAPPIADIYMPLAQHPFYANEVQVIARTTVTTATVVPALRRAMARIAPATALKFTTLDDMVATSIGTPRFRMLLIALFAALALLLAMAGVYGVMAFVTAERTAEFGVRMALGARRREIFGLVLRRALRLAVAGLALGLALSMAGGRLIEQMLFGLRPLDAPTYGAVVVLLALMVVIAALVPAWQASRVDPLRALRQE